MKTTVIGQNGERTEKSASALPPARAQAQRARVRERHNEEFAVSFHKTVVSWQPSGTSAEPSRKRTMDLYRQSSLEVVSGIPLEGYGDSRDSDDSPFATLGCSYLEHRDNAVSQGQAHAQVATRRDRIANREDRGDRRVGYADQVRPTLASIVKLVRIFPRCNMKGLTTLPLSENLTAVSSSACKALT